MTDGTALTDTIARLEDSAASHKRLAAHHRRQAAADRRALEVLMDYARANGIAVIVQSKPQEARTDD